MRKLTPFLMFHRMLASINGRGRECWNKTKGIDIEKEYQLILQKKSGLSANMRQLVIAQHMLNHQIEEEQNEAFLSKTKKIPSV